jgi:two-component system chemotaxis response regulator CheB
MISPIRVLVVDDSALMRKLIPQILQTDGSIQVVGTAMNGDFGLKKIEELKPEVVTLDLEMPGMSGLELLQEIMRRQQLPVVVVSSHSREQASVTLRALALGAFDFVTKPRDVATNMGEISRELIAKVKAAAQSHSCSFPLASRPAARDSKAAANGNRPSKIIAIGVSTGGPQALDYLLPQLPASFPAAILIVQHMPEGFTEKFARRLDEISAIRVKEAQSGDLLLAGRALVAPGNRHLKVKRRFPYDVAVLGDEPTVNGHRPSADVLFESVAGECGPDSIAVLMTGMGEDGAEGMAAVKLKGGLTIAQSEESCVVYGMPRVAIERGYANQIIGLRSLADSLVAYSAAEQGESGTPRHAGSLVV